MDIFLDCIKKGKYKEAKDALRAIPTFELCNFIVGMGFDTNQLELYTFVIFLLIENESAELHYCAATLIAQVFSYLEGAYSMGLLHARRAVELSPDDPSYKEYLLSYYYIPDKLITLEEAITIAKELQAQDPNNVAAAHFFEDIESKIPNYLKK